MKDLGVSRMIEQNKPRIDWVMRMVHWLVTFLEIGSERILEFLKKVLYIYILALGGVVLATASAIFVYASSAIMGFKDYSNAMLLISYVCICCLLLMLFLPMVLLRKLGRIEAFSDTARILSRFLFWLMQVFLSFYILPVWDHPGVIPVIMILSFGFFLCSFAYGIKPSPQLAWFRMVIISAVIISFLIFPSTKQYGENWISWLDEKISSASQDIGMPQMIRYDLNNIDSLVIFGQDQKPRIWYYQDGNGNYQLFDKLGVNPSTGEILKPMTKEVIQAIKRKLLDEQAEKRKQQVQADKLRQQEEERGRAKEARERETRGLYIDQANLEPWRNENHHQASGQKALPSRIVLEKGSVISVALDQRIRNDNTTKGTLVPCHLVEELRNDDGLILIGQGSQCVLLVLKANVEKEAMTWARLEMVLYSIETPIGKIAVSSGRFVIKNGSFASDMKNMALNAAGGALGGALYGGTGGMKQGVRAGVSQGLNPPRRIVDLARGYQIDFVLLKNAILENSEGR